MGLNHEPTAYKPTYYLFDYTIAWADITLQELLGLQFNADFEQQILEKLFIAILLCFQRFLDHGVYC